MQILLLHTTTKPIRLPCKCQYAVTYLSESIKQDKDSTRARAWLSCLVGLAHVSPKRKIDGLHEYTCTVLRDSTAQLQVVKSRGFGCGNWD